MTSETKQDFFAGETIGQIREWLQKGASRKKDIFSIHFQEEPIPVIALHGEQTGPTVWIQAALHGDECDGTAAILRMADTLAGRLERGNVLMVPVVSGAAFREGRLSSPKDGKNLNRMAKDTEQPVTWSKAYFDWLEEVISATSQVMVDLHGGGYYLDVLPFAILPAGEHADFEAERRLVAGCGLSCILQSAGRGSLVETLAERGLCTALLECGGGTALSEKAINTHIRNVEKILENLDMLKLKNSSGTEKRDQCSVLTGAVDVYFERDGILKSAAPVGSVVHFGDELYRTADWETLEETVFRCPVPEAVILSVHNSALVRKGAYAIYLGISGGCPDQ